MKKLFIIGAGGHGKVVADIALHNGYKDLFFIDDLVSGEFVGFPVVARVMESKRFCKEGDFFVAIGNCETRKIVSERLRELGANLVSLVHPSAVIGRNAIIGKGTVIMPGAIVNASVTIGNGVIINTKSSIDHDCKIGDYCHVSVGATIAGTVVVKDNCFIGAGATIVNNVTIQNNCIIGAGAVVIKDIKESGTYVGVPCLKLKS